MSRVAKTPQTYIPGLEEGLGQTTRQVLCVSALIPFSPGKVGSNLWIASLRLWPSWYQSLAKALIAKTDKWYGKMFLSGAQHCPAVFLVILHCVKMRKVETINFRFGGSSTTFCNSGCEIANLYLVLHYTLNSLLTYYNNTYRYTQMSYQHKSNLECI